MATTLSVSDLVLDDALRTQLKLDGIATVFVTLSDDQLQIWGPRE